MSRLERRRDSPTVTKVWGCPIEFTFVDGMASFVSLKIWTRQHLWIDGFIYLFWWWLPEHVFGRICSHPETKVEFVGHHFKGHFFGAKRNTAQCTKRTPGWSRALAPVEGIVKFEIEDASICLNRWGFCWKANSNVRKNNRKSFRVVALKTVAGVCRFPCNMTRVWMRRPLSRYTRVCTLVQPYYMNPLLIQMEYTYRYIILT